MLNDKGFDLWADGYDASVNLSDEDDAYPFAGYKRVLGRIYETVRRGGGKRVLDIGFGTAVLTSRLYADGYAVTGVDFSQRMLQLAKEKMPDARLIRHDFSQGLPEQLSQCVYDAILSTYALHHLTDEQKLRFLRDLQTHLAPGGKILIGDVSFATAAELDGCREASGDEWDDEEFYFVADELCKAFPSARYEKISHCAGILSLENH